MDNKLKIALYCIIKKENDYIEEYVKYYHNLGVDKIFIYDNNDVDGENPKDLLDKYDYVEIINCRGKRNFQIHAYNDCIDNHYQEFDWMLLFDADEFLQLNVDNNIKEYLGRDCFKNMNCIQPSCRDFDDNDLLGNENNNDRSLVNRFTHYANRKTQHPVKSIIHTSLKKAHMISSNCPSINEKICEGDGTIKQKGTDYYKDNYVLYQVNHYRKTIIEFLESKFNKTWADGANSILPNFDWYWKYSCSKQTAQKLAIIEDFNKTHKINYNIH